MGPVTFINRWRGVFSGGRVKKKYCCVRGSFQENKNIGGCFVNSI